MSDKPLLPLDALPAGDTDESEVEGDAAYVESVLEADGVALGLMTDDTLANDELWELCLVEKVEEENSCVNDAVNLVTN